MRLRVTTSSAPHSVVQPSANSTDEVPGTIFEITQVELQAADGYDVSDYKRVHARLKSGRDAWVYIKI